MTKSPQLKVSIIVPCGGEPEDLSHNLEALKQVSGWYELIVIVPGDDNYRMESEGVKMLSCPFTSRSIQSNMGAALAEGDAFLFLPPNIALPRDTIVGMREALKFPKCVGGGFALEFEKKSRSLERIANTANKRGNSKSLFLWEQGIFIRRSVFEKIGGFSLTEQVDDFELCRAMSQLGSLALLHPPVIAKGDKPKTQDLLTSLKFKMIGGAGFKNQDLFGR